jgi:hypothetical protein
MIGRLHEGMHLPHFVQRQAQAKGRHLRALADYGLQKTLVAELGGEEVRPRAPELSWAGVALDGKMPGSGAIAAANKEREQRR